MYNRLYKYPTEKKFSYCKQFELQKGYFPEHEVLKIVEQINQWFRRNEFTLGIFVDLCKAFDIGDHEILQKN